MNTSTEIATEIVNQINRLDFFARARWGVKMMLTDGNTLQLEASRSRKIRITLDASDTYTIEIGKYVRRTFTYSVLQTESGIYADQLVRVIDRFFN